MKCWDCFVFRMITKILYKSTTLDNIIFQKCQVSWYSYKILIILNKKQSEHYMTLLDYQTIPFKSSKGSKYLSYERKQVVLSVCFKVQGRADPPATITQSPSFLWKYYNGAASWPHCWLMHTNKWSVSQFTNVRITWSNTAYNQSKI